MNTVHVSASRELYYLQKLSALYFIITLSNYRIIPLSHYHIITLSFTFFPHRRQLHLLRQFVTKVFFDPFFNKH